MPKHKELTAKEERAVHEYILNGFSDKTDACRKAGYAHPNVQSADVFSRPHIKVEINKRRNRMKKKMEIEEAEVLAGLKALALANPAKIVMKLEQNDYDLSCLTDEELYIIQKIKTTEEQGKEYVDTLKREIGAESRIAAWDKLARFLGMYDDKLTLKGELSLVDRIQAGRRRAALEGGGDED